MYIEKINSPKDVKGLTIEQLNILVDEMREALIKRASLHMGHVGPDLGFIETTVALHYVFDSPKDKIIYDISHQTYPHKMLTGRKDAYLYEENYGDVGPYTNPRESEHDFFELGHTSTAIDLAIGMAKARDLSAKEGNVVGIIGDGSLSGGQALEGLNVAGEFEGNLIILFNDNQMSIAENHGGLYQNLQLLRETNGEAENNLFKAMGLEYAYLNEGNDVGKLIEALEAVKDTDKPIVLHINTLKGKGYKFAEEEKEPWHWHLPFDIGTGETKPEYTFDGETYNDITAEFLLDKMAKDPKVVAIAAGVPNAMGFNPQRRIKAGKQYMDVGIAEQSAVSIASGIAKNGGKPVFAVEAPFMQRAYDQIFHDVAINHSPVTILVDSASIFGMSDVTHIGFFDLAMISNIPEVVCLAPASKDEYLAMLDWSLEQQEHPVIIRISGDDPLPANYPVRTSYDEIGRFQLTKEGSDIAIIAPGTFYGIGEASTKELKAKYGIDASLINPGFVSYLDRELLDYLKKNHKLVAVLEDGVIEGGFGSKIASFYSESDMKVKLYGLPKGLYDRFNANKLIKEYRISPEMIAEDLNKLL